MDSMERARRALTRLPNSATPPLEVVKDVADAIRNAQKAVLLQAAQSLPSRVYNTMSLDESKHRRAEAAEIAAVIEKLATGVK
ncbi:MAG: hypothetical protein U0Q12_22520 [Vicinamibacterales bacterium]